MVLHAERREHAAQSSVVIDAVAIDQRLIDGPA